jgi:hypothetical protein
MPARGCGGDLIEKALMGKNPARHKRCGDTCPAEQISWEDVQGFIRKLNQKEGTDKYRTGLGVTRTMKWSIRKDPRGAPAG